MFVLEKHQSRKIAVVAVGGPFKSGKSFLSNRIIG
jgi:uridine kinase